MRGRRDFEVALEHSEPHIHLESFGIIYLSPGGTGQSIESNTS